jgi:uncharacterized damage-inducible protein DinB
MASDRAHLFRYYEGWDRYDDLLVDAIGNLTDEQLMLRAAPSLRPVWTLAAHIIGTRIGWFHGVMGVAVNLPNLEDMETWDEDGQPARSGAELAKGLRDTWAMIAECLNDWTPDALDQIFTSHRGAQRSRQWIIWHVIEHDLHHGGELFFTLGMHGLPTPDL